MNKWIISIWKFKQKWPRHVLSVRFQNIKDTSRHKNRHCFTVSLMSTRFKSNIVTFSRRCTLSVWLRLCRELWLVHIYCGKLISPQLRSVIDEWTEADAIDAVCYVILLSAEGYFCYAVCSSGNYLPGCEKDEAGKTYLGRRNIREKLPASRCTV